MKRVLLIAVILLMTSMLVFAGGKKDSGDAAAPFIVDLSTLKLATTSGNPDAVTGDLGNVLRNPNALTRSWEDVLWILPDNFVDVSKYTRITVTANFYNAAGEKLNPRDSMAMITFIYDLAGDWRGPGSGPGRNTPIKEFNLMGFSGMIHKDRGSRHGMNQAPKGLLIQRAQDASLAFVELVSVVFHNGNYQSGAEVSGAGPEGSDEE